MDKEFDLKMKELFQKDNYIPNSTKAIITETIEKNRINPIKVSNKSFKMKKIMSVLATLVIMFLGVNVYAYATGKTNIFSALMNSMHINQEKYEKEKIELIKDDELENEVIPEESAGTNVGTNEATQLLLKEYAYNDEFLIVNYIFKTNKDNLSNLYIYEDGETLLDLGDEAGCVPVFEITTKTVDTGYNAYLISKVYEMSHLNVKEGKIKFKVISVFNEEFEENIDETFELTISEKTEKSKKYTVSDNTIYLNFSELRNKKHLDFWGEYPEKFSITRITETNLGTLLEITSNFDLFLTDLENANKLENVEYYSPNYTFEIIDNNGNILNTRDDQVLSLNADVKQENLIIKPLENASSFTIKIYEETTDTLLGEKEFFIDK